MKSRVLTTVTAMLAVAAAGTICSKPVAAQQIINSPTTQNVFSTLIGKSDDQITAKLGINQYGDIDWSGDVWNEAYEKYFGLDQPLSIVHSFNSNEAYVYDEGNRDIRSEGMGYGLMIAVQAGDHELFDRLYRFVKNHMLVTYGQNTNYITYHVDTNGNNLDPGNPGPISDGDEWISAALLLASRRWDSRYSAFNYQGDAQTYMHNMLYPASGGDNSLFGMDGNRPGYHIVGPYAGGRDYTDQSYVLPAFYALFADMSWYDKDTWSDIYNRGKNLLGTVPNGSSHGLQPDACDNSGNLYYGGDPSWRYFGFDAHRTTENMAVDKGWTNAPASNYWAIGSARQSFFLSTNFEGLRFDMNGYMVGEGSSAGLNAMNACASETYEWSNDIRAAFVQHLWDDNHYELSQPGGYYSKSLYVLGLLVCSGRFRNFG